MNEMIELAQRLERAAGPDRELDEEIAAALVGAVREVQSDGRAAYHRDGHWVSVDPIKDFTASLDDAMTLIPKGWMIDRLAFWPAQESVYSHVNLRGPFDAAELKRSCGRSWGYPARAMAAACLRAHAAQGGEAEGGDGEAGSVHEHPVGEADAPKVSRP